MGTHLTIDARAQKGSLMAALRRAAPAVVKAAAVPIGQGLVDGISGFGRIRRVDTTRYRGAWAQGFEAATGATLTDAGQDMVQAGDAFGSVEQWNTGASLRIANTVPYGSFLEWGTSTMRPGFHVTWAMHFFRPAAKKSAALVLRRVIGGSRA